MQQTQHRILEQATAQAPTTRRRASRWWKAALTLGLVALAPVALAGPYKIFGNHYAWVNNFNDPNNIIQGTFGTGSTPELTVTFNFADYNLYGYPAIVRGWHYDWNPTSDTLFPKQISSISSIPMKFSYSAGGTNLAGDFAYDIFFRWDTAKGNPQLEVMIWGEHNSWPIGTLTASKVITAGGRTFDLWEGFNSGAGYYVYTFIPTGTAGQATLKTSGSLNVDAKPFLNWLQTNRSKDGRYNNSMYLHAAEAGFEVVRGNGWAKVSATMDAK
ncbi:cellulase [Xanthomonas campestris pv. raphani]|uniref:GH12 family glycosyl hydrolase domain-containing protein n=1 Tax=Xanthomonas campestris TaxID=339 RepID=UPI002B23A15E|nr:cellulase [Xanthomonas campestris]MEA9761246.1 cellulase [Xanthomonas campestris pv. raphani]